MNLKAKSRILVVMALVALAAAIVASVAGAAAPHIGKNRRVAPPQPGHSAGVVGHQVGGREDRQPAAIAEASCERGLSGWNIAGVGEVVPSVVQHNGVGVCRFLLTGQQSRSELGFGGNGTADPVGSPSFVEGDEYWYGFSFYIGQMIWGHPGSQNLIMQFKSEGEGSPNFGLQLWNWSGEDGNGGRGLWSEGESMKVGGEEHRFLAPISEQAWHEIQIHFKASSTGAGFYELFLDGNLLETRRNVSMILPGKRSAYIKDGLYRYGPVATGTSELLLDDARLGTTQASVASPAG